jgi:hypothetical protein
MYNEEQERKRVEERVLALMREEEYIETRQREYVVANPVYYTPPPNVGLTPRQLAHNREQRQRERDLALLEEGLQAQQRQRERDDELMRRVLGLREEDLQTRQSQQMRYTPPQPSAERRRMVDHGVPTTQKKRVPGEKDLAKDKKAKEGETPCVVCTDNQPCCIILPCAHMVLCVQCSRKVDDHCPVCRERVEEIKVVYK